VSVAMRKLVGGMTAALFLVLCAQSGAQSGTAGRALNLEFISPPVKPGDPVFVNALLANPAGDHVLVIRENIQFPREKLVFSQARLGIAAELADAELSLNMKDKSGAKVKDKQAADSLEVTITAKKTFPDGPLIEFEFRLADPKTQSIPLTHKAEALDDQGKKIAAFTFSDVKVEVTKEVAPTPMPAIGCFFFTH
jgi:hypothetical protein